MGPILSRQFESAEKCIMTVGGTRYYFLSQVLLGAIRHFKVTLLCPRSAKNDAQFTIIKVTAHNVPRLSFAKSIERKGLTGTGTGTGPGTVGLEGFRHIIKAPCSALSRTIGVRVACFRERGPDYAFFPPS